MDEILKFFKDNSNTLIAASGWLFGLISCVVAIIQLKDNNKYKREIKELKLNSKIDTVETGDHSKVIKATSIRSRDINL